jgi:hypothetical protein
MFSTNNIKVRKNFIPFNTIQDGMFVKSIDTSKSGSFMVEFGKKDYESIKCFVYEPNGDTPEKLEKQANDLVVFLKDLFTVNNVEGTFTANTFADLAKVVETRLKGITNLPEGNRVTFAAKIVNKKSDKGVWPAIRAGYGVLAKTIDEIAWTPWEEANVLTVNNVNTGDATSSSSQEESSDDLPF